MTQRTLKIFLCHSSSDKAFVRELYKRVKSEGFEPWLDEECLLPGQDWDLEIRKAVRASDIVVVCLSRSSVSKEGYIQKEIRAALDCADEKLDGSIFIVPLRLDDCNVPNRLSRWHWVNFFEDGGWEKLFRALASRSRDLEGSFDPTLPTVASAPKVTPDRGQISVSEPDFRSRLRRRSRIVFPVATTLLLIAILAAYVVLRSFASPETVLRLAGSKTINNYLALNLIRAFLEHEGARDIKQIPQMGGNRFSYGTTARMPGRRHPVLFSVQANGSATGFKALESQIADIASSVRPISDDEAGLLQSLGDMRSPECENVLALDGIAIVVNRNNPVTGLTKQQIRQLFSGKINDWTQIGGQSGSIHIYGLDELSGAYDTFEALVLSSLSAVLTQNLTIENSGAEVARAVSSDPNGVGYLSIADIGDTKALQVSDGPGTTPLLPSVFTVATEDYALSRRLYLYTPSHSIEFARRFTEFALSPEGQRVVQQAGYINLTPHLEEVVVPTSAPPTYRATVAGLRRLSLNFRFRPNSMVLDNKALADIPRTVAALSENGFIRNVRVLGFSDDQGSPSVNQKLSETRAEGVAEKLRAYGIAAEFKGFSSSMPVGDNSTMEGRQRNRRVEVWAE